MDAQHYLPALTLKGNLNRGETPATPSMRELKRTIGIASIKAGSHETEAAKSCDDNELSEWQSDGKMENAWITYQLQEKVAVDEITVKLTGWRDKMYPLEIYAGKRLLWKGYTYPTLG